MQHRRLLQGFSVAVLGFALTSAPMAMASASSYKAKHHKAHKPPKHNKKKTSKPVVKGGSNPNASICVGITSALSSSGNLGAAIGKVLQDSAAGNFATGKQAMIDALNTALQGEGQVESDLRSAPSDVQSAMKGLYSFESTLKTTISNASSPIDIEQAFATFGQNTQLKTDSLTISNYVTSVCGGITTTTSALP